jgi:filamentous hemagglutinin
MPAGIKGSSLTAGGNVSVSAGTAGSGDLNIIGSRIAAPDRVAADLNIDVGGGLIVSAGRNFMETDTSNSRSGSLSKASERHHTYDEETVGSELAASGNVNLNASKNLAIAGSSVNAGQNIAVEGESVSVIAAQEHHDSASSSKKSGVGAGSGDGFVSLRGRASELTTQI